VPGLRRRRAGDFSVLPHMPCAYVGPQYDFTPTVAGYILSKSPARHCVGRPCLRDRGGQRALCPMSQGDMCRHPPFLPKRASIEAASSRTRVKRRHAAATRGLDRRIKYYRDHRLVHHGLCRHRNTSLRLQRRASFLAGRWRTYSTNQVTMIRIGNVTGTCCANYCRSKALFGIGSQRPAR